MNKKYRVVEFFNSIQGEGNFQGIPTFFLRLADCNKNCDFCDTDWKNNILEYDFQELVDLILENSFTKNIVITGGEPFLQEVQELTAFLLREHNFQAHIETNGSIPEMIPQFTYFRGVSIAPKTPEDLAKVWSIPVHFFGKISLKILVPFFDQTDIEDLLLKMDSIRNNRMTFYIMPVNGETSIDETNQNSAMYMASDLKKIYPNLDIRFGTQIHKYLKVR